MAKRVRKDSQLVETNSMKHISQMDKDTVVVSEISDTWIERKAKTETFEYEQNMAVLNQLL